eukprot:975540-Pyramimonas_sp.AAC.1
MTFMHWLGVSVPEETEKVGLHKAMKSLLSHSTPGEFNSPTNSPGGTTQFVKRVALVDMKREVLIAMRNFLEIGPISGTPSTSHELHQLRITCQIRHFGGARPGGGLGQFVLRHAEKDHERDRLRGRAFGN